MHHALRLRADFEDVFGLLADITRACITWHNQGRRDPWSGGEPAMLGMLHALTDTAVGRGPYAACRTFSSLPPDGLWIDLVDGPEASRLAAPTDKDQREEAQE